MTPIADFVPFVAMRVDKDMPYANIEHAVREALVFFLEQTRAAVADEFSAQNCKDYEVFLDLPACRRLVGVEGVYVVPQGPCGPHHGPLRWQPDWEEITFSSYSGQPGWSVDEVDGDLTTLWVSPAPSAERRLCINYSWTPKRDATCEVPGWVFERYADAIADGALAYLHSNPADKAASSQFAGLTSRGFREAIEASRTRKRATRFGPRQLQMSSAPFFKG